MSGLPFDADAHLARLPKAQLTIGGATYIGRHLAGDAQRRHLAALQRITDGTATPAEERAIVRALVLDFFPVPLTSAPARPWRPWPRRPAREPLTVADLVEALPLELQQAAVTHLVEVLARTAGIPVPYASDGAQEAPKPPG